MVLAYDIKIVM